MRTRERLSCGVGNVFNDLYVQLLFSFEILFFMKVMELSASQAGLILLIGQISDALMSPITGYLGDNVNIPLLSNKIGRRKSWHLVGAGLMAISIPLLFNKCFLCDENDQSWLPLVYFGFFSALINGSFNLVEINHLAFITTVAEKVAEFTALTALRTMFSFLSGVYVYVIAWALLGQDSGDDLGPKSLSEFAYLSWIATGTGVLFALVFYVGTKEPKNRVRKSSTYMDFMNAGGLFMGVFEMENENTRKNSLVRKLVGMFVTSSDEKAYQEEGHQETENYENRQRKRSLLQTFVNVIYYDDENKIDHNSSQTEIKKTPGDPRNEDTKTQMVLELQKLDRDRKKSLLVRVIDALLSRSDQSQEDLSTEGIEDQVPVDSANDEYTSGENYCREEGPQDVVKENKWDNSKKVDIVKDKEESRELGISREYKTASVSAKCRQRRSGVVSIPDGGKLGKPNFGFEFERSEEIEGQSSSDTSGLPKQKKSVTFLPVLPSVKEVGEKESKFDVSVERPTIVTEAREVKASVEDGNNPSASEDKQEMLGLPVPSPIHLVTKRRPKSIKQWLKNPNLYTVAIIFTCSRLVQSTVYAYLPLFLTERLQFAKEAIAYFPLVLLISASLSSMLCEKLNKKIGTKWSYLLAASLVIGGVVWSYFQTPSIKQTTYALVIIIGSGMSIMYVMALAFMTELIGENKDSSSSVISIITVITRLSSGGIVIGVQAFYPEKDTDSNEAISNYVQHVFAMAPGILTLVGFLLVLFFQPSMLACKTKVPKDDIEAQADEDKSSPDDVGSQFSPEKRTATPSAPQDVNQTTAMVMMHQCPEDTKL